MASEKDCAVRKKVHIDWPFCSDSDTLVELK